jgi:hypothetical protein
MIYLLFVIPAICICILRDPYQAADAKFYSQFYLDPSQLPVEREPVILWVSHLCQAFEFNDTLFLYIIGIIPLVVVILSAVSIGQPYLILSYSSTEIFPLLSFNGVRQGFAESFLILSIAQLILFLRTKRVLPLLCSLIAIIFSSLSHTSVVLILIGVLLVFIGRLVCSQIFTALFSLRIYVRSVIIVATSLLFIGSMYLALPLLSLHILDLFLSRDNSAGSLNSGIWGPIYRIIYGIVLPSVLIYSIKPTEKNQFYTNFLRNVSIHFLILFSILPIVLNSNLVALNRLTYYAPLFYVFILPLFLHRQYFPPLNISPFSRFCALIFCLIISVITWSSSAVLQNI